MSAHHTCAPNRPGYTGQAIEPSNRAPYVCRWCRAAELQPGEKRDFATRTDQWQLPTLCTPCAITVGTYFHVNFPDIVVSLGGLVNGLAKAAEK